MGTAYSGLASAGYSFGTCYTQCYNTATMANVSATQTNVTLEGAVKSGKDGYGYLSLQGVECQVGNAGGGGTGGSWHSTTARMDYGNWVAKISHTYSFTRGHSAYKVDVWTKYWGNPLNGAASAIKQSGAVHQTVTIPAKTSYAVKYDANGGSGAPTGQTKWYGESLTISSGKPTRSLHNFKGWSTSRGGSVSYQPGAKYTGNAALTLYAVWEVAYVQPTISSVSCYRCDQSGAALDDGEYARAALEWSVDTTTSKGNAVESIRIGYREAGSSGNYSYGTVQGGTSGTSGTAYAILGGGLSQDKRYEVVLEVTDSTSYANHTTTAHSVISKAFFTMDFYRGGKGVAFGTASTGEGFECAMPARFTGGLRIGDTEISEEKLRALLALL